MAAVRLNIRNFLKYAEKQSPVCANFAQFNFYKCKSFATR